MSGCRKGGYRFRIIGAYVTAMPISRPDPCYLDECESLGARNGVKRWRHPNGKRLFTWDSLHGEIEVFNLRGEHVGVAHPVTGAITGEAVKGRTIDV